VVTKKIAADELEVGDIITFIAPDSRYGGISITHRILDVYYDESLGSYTYRTKGDANNVADKPITIDTIKGKVNFHIPFVGAIISIIKSPVGVICILGVSIFLLALSYRKEKEQETLTRNCNTAINHMKQALGGVRKAESYHASRTYKPRILKDTFGE
jgi:hypothetical protein